MFIAPPMAPCFAPPMGYTYCLPWRRPLRSIPALAGESVFAGLAGCPVSIAGVTSPDYHVDIVPLDSLEFTGEIWVTNRTINSFVVVTSGSGNLGAFAWVIEEDSMLRGESTFAGQIGQTINIAEVESPDYHVSITQLEESGSVGEIWVSTRTVNAFVVKNSGSDALSAFSWRVSGVELAA